MDYQIEEIIRDELAYDATLQGLGVKSRVYTDHISDLKDPEFPCITMHFKGGDWNGTSDNVLSVDSIEIEICSDKKVAPKKQIDTIYKQVNTLIRDKTLVNSNYNVTIKSDGRPTTMAFYDDVKKRTIYKKTINYHLIDQDLQ